MLQSDVNHLRVASSIPGRIRVHLWASGADGKDRIEAVLSAVPGVRGVQVNALTGTVLVHYDVTCTKEPAILACLGTLQHAIERPDPLAAG